MSEEQSDNPQERKYKFKATIVVKENWVNDVNSQGHASKYIATMCYLIPDTSSDQAMKFLSAWLPDLALEPGKEVDHNTRAELALELASPLNGPCRAAIMRANHNCSEHHLQVASLGVEQDITRLKLGGKQVMVTALSCREEDHADQAKDSDSDAHA
jgi:hypothetical protein